MSRGCTPSFSQTGEVVVHDNDEYKKASKDAMELSRDPLAQLDRNEKLTPEDMDNLRHALRLYEGMYGFIPTNHLPHFAMGQIMEALGEHEKAIKYLQDYLDWSVNGDSEEAKVTRADSHLIISQACIMTHDYKRAVDEANEALKSYPGNVSYTIARARAEIQLGDKKKAADDLSAALAKEPTNSLAMSLYKLVNH